MANLPYGPAREPVVSPELRGEVAAGTLVLDGKLVRTRYVDGMLLAARDLTRGQQYFLHRQALLARAVGPGVARGLEVVAGDGPSEVRIAAGHGVTPSGELVVLPDDHEVDLADVVTSERLNATFGLSLVPGPAARSRSDLFVLGLRAVELTANPIASYPTFLDAPRSVADGDVVEASAAVLIPYPDDGALDQPGRARGRVAHRIFVREGIRGLPGDFLPLAMLSLERGAVRWLDVFMVRREIGAGGGDVLGLGQAPGAVRAAHFQQYRNHLEELLAERRDSGAGEVFAAGEHFDALPPAGPLPPALINAGNFTQSFFPPAVSVDLAMVPSDEVPQLLEESLRLPSLDLTLGARDLESTSVLVVLPVERASLPGLVSRLGAATADDLTHPLSGGAPFYPTDRLHWLRLAPATLAVAPRAETVDAVWREQLGTLETLWFVRQRNFDVKSEITGVVVDLGADELEREARLAEALKSHRLHSSYRRVLRRASAPGRAEVVALLAGPGMIDSGERLKAALRRLEAVERIDSPAVAEVAREIAAPEAGAGEET